MKAGSMLERVAATISRWGMFRRGDRVGVACSGGADSVCLLDVLVRPAPRWELRLCVVHSRRFGGTLDGLAATGARRRGFAG